MWSCEPRCFRLGGAVSESTSQFSCHASFGPSPPRSHPAPYMPPFLILTPPKPPCLGHITHHCAVESSALPRSGHLTPGHPHYIGSCATHVCSCSGRASCQPSPRILILCWLVMAGGPVQALGTRQQASSPTWVICRRGHQVQKKGVPMSSHLKAPALYKVLAIPSSP